MWNTVELEITKECNSYCKHCLANAGKKRAYEFNLKELEPILSQLKNNNFKKIIVTGGEPLIRRGVFEIISLIKQYDFNIILNTNTLLFNEEKIKRVSRLGVELVRTSVYGSNSKTHDYITGVNGSFNTSMKRIDELKKYKLRLGVSVVVGKYNLNQIDEIAELLINKKVDTINFVRIVPGGRAKSLENELCLNPLEHQEYLHKVLLLREKYGVGTGYLKSAETFQFLFDSSKEYKICNAGSSNIGIRSDLKVTPCLALVELIVGDLKKSTIDEILNSNELRFFREFPKNKKHVDKECFKCEHLDFCKCGCRAHAYYSTGRINAKDPGCWL